MVQQIGRSLTQEQLEGQLSLVDLLLCMYSADDEITIHQDSRECYRLLKDSLDHGVSLRIGVHTRIVLHLRVPLLRDVSADNFTLQISVPLIIREVDDPTVPTLSIMRPSFLHKRQFDEVQSDLPSGSPDCVQEAIEYLQNIRPSIYTETVKTSSDDHFGDEVVRAWFYFPSLSTRQKRNDLVSLAPDYNLTGFVLAGKPGVLCVEGTTEKIQAYIADIKRNSWGDIPSFQKKITERFREADITHRKFSSMREITDDIERHGQRGNRGDLAQVEQFLQEHELGKAFAIVFMQKT